MMTDVTKMNDFHWEFQAPTVIMVPYKADQLNVFPETFMVSLYQRLVEQKLLDTIFPGMGIAHLNQFIGFVNTHSFLIGFVRQGDEIVDTAGFGYITEVDGKDGARKAGFGFGFFKEWHATKEARFISWFFLGFWMKELKIDALFGTTLKTNRLARNFSYNFGFTGHTDIPKLFYRRGELQDGTVMVLERDNFENLYDQFREEYIPGPMEAAVRG